MKISEPTDNLDFTQVDIEASFLNEEEFRAIIEAMVSEVMDKVLGLKLDLPIQTMSYDDAMHFYGSDKPDLRFGLKLQEVKQLVYPIDLCGL